MNPERTPAGAVTGWLVGVATAIVVLALAVVPFLSPAWVGFEQDRVGSAALTGYSEPDLHAATNSILGDLVLARGDFAVSVGGTPVLNDRERAHMVDVRGVFAGFGLVALASALGMAFVGLRARTDAARRKAWAGVRRGATGLAIGIGVAGIVSIVAFDTAFELFHELFFPAGSFDFDPRTSKLVQLFPDAFWSETTLAVGAVALIGALAVRWFAGRRAMERHAAAVGAAPVTAVAPDRSARDRSAAHGASR